MMILFAMDGFRNCTVVEKYVEALIASRKVPVAPAQRPFKDKKVLEFFFGGTLFENTDQNVVNLRTRGLITTRDS